MRVAFVAPITTHHRDDERLGRLRTVAVALAERGHEVVVCCSKWWDGDHEVFEDDALTYHAVTDRLQGERFWAQLPRVLREFDPDVIHAVHERPSHVVSAGLAGRVLGAPLLVDWYDLHPTPQIGGVLGGLRRGARERLRERAARTPDRTVVPSRTVKTGLREIGGRAERIEVIPNAVDFDLVRSVDPADGGDIVYSRRLDADANLESLLLALAEFREREWSATVIGDGPAREHYEEQAADLRIDDRVEFVGERPVAERVALFKNAHVYVQTARRCAFPTDLVWALCSGCVGIVEYHADSSAHEIVEQEERGFLVTSEKELTQRLAAAGDLDARAIDESFERFDERTIVRRYVDAYRQMGAVE